MKCYLKKKIDLIAPSCTWKHVKNVSQLWTVNSRTNKHLSIIFLLLCLLWVVGLRRFQAMVVWILHWQFLASQRHFFLKSRSPLTFTYHTLSRVSKSFSQQIFGLATRTYPTLLSLEGWSIEHLVPLSVRCTTSMPTHAWDNTTKARYDV